MSKKKFINGFDSWRETHFEIVSYIAIAMQGYIDAPAGTESAIYEARESGGITAVWDLAEAWTDEFELLNKKREWDGEFYEEVEMFAKSKDLGTDFQAELAAWNEKASLKADELKDHKEIVRPADSKEAEDLYLTFPQRELLVRHRLIHYNVGYRYFIDDLEEIKEQLATLF